MIDNFGWAKRICDLCQKSPELQPDLSEMKINEDGRYAENQHEKLHSIWRQWEEKMTHDCLVIHADMDEIVICRQHLHEILQLRDYELQQNISNCS